MDRNNKKISLLTFTGDLELASGTASLTDCGIRFWEDPLDPNKSGMTLHFGTLKTPHLIADANFVVNVQCLNDIIREGDLLALNLLSLKGSFEVLNSTQWDGEISLSEPVIIDPNFSYQTLVLPSKIELKGSYTKPNSISFDGTITAKFHNTRELTPLTEIAYQRATEIGKNPADPNLIVFDPNTIEQANTELSNSFGLAITRTMPVNVLDPNALGANTNAAEIKYGLYLAALSKMADSSSIDTTTLIQKLADQIKDVKTGEFGEITLNDIGDALVEVIDPNNNIIDPNIANLGSVQEIAEDQSTLFDEFYDPNDPNGVF